MQLDVEEGQGCWMLLIASYGGRTIVPYNPMRNSSNMIRDEDDSTMSNIVDQMRVSKI
jgi:hypothetical protein